LIRCSGLVLLLGASVLAVDVTSGTSRPVIGILTQPTNVDPSYNLSSYGDSYLVASYVKWVEAAGARVVPVPWDAPSSLLSEYFSHTNGMLFPGGGTPLHNSTYRETGETLFQLAKAANARGEVYPLWGTCLGFEELMSLSVSPTSVLRHTAGTDPMLAPVRLTAAAARSKLLRGDTATQRALQEGNVSVNLHNSGVYLKTFDSNGLGSFWDVLGTNEDAKGVTFVSLAEAKAFPFFAAQFHPEKNAYEWEQAWSSDAQVAAAAHSRHAVDAMHSLAATFVGYARQSEHLPDPTQIIDVLASPLYTGGGLIPPRNMQTYVFKMAPTMDTEQAACMAEGLGCEQNFCSGKGMLQVGCCCLTDFHARCDGSEETTHSDPGQCRDVILCATNSSVKWDCADPSSGAIRLQDWNAFVTKSKGQGLSPVRDACTKAQYC